MAKLWGGRFEKRTEGIAEGFHASLPFDGRLYKEDIEGSVAHARMLGKIGVLTQEETRAIVDGLAAIRGEIEQNGVDPGAPDEDIHSYLERLLTERIGETGKKLHTGRSRNDQVALDMRMYMKGTIARIRRAIGAVLGALVTIARDNLHTYMPAFTHLQHAQPTTLAHYMMAYFEMFKRDALRFADCLERTDVLPLGSGAACATAFPLDRDMVAGALGFGAVSDNSMDAVSDRDFLIEFAACASICMMHLSRFCEELVLWTTGEFKLAEMDDAFATGSSMMPQKKNPDMAELIRGKTGRVYGSLTALLVTMKALPLAYNKDMQEDKEAAFDAADTLHACLAVFAPMLRAVRFLKENMLESAGRGFANATDAADYLVKKGLPFREAHEIVGKLVLRCECRGIPLEALSLEELRAFSPLFEADVLDVLSLESCVERRGVTGGPAPQSVKRHIEKAEAFVKSLQKP